MDKIIKEKQQFQRIVVSRDEALAMFQENKFKVELITALPEVKAMLQVDISLTRVLKALVFQLHESASLSSRWFQTSTCAPTPRT